MTRFRAASAESRARAPAPFVDRAVHDLARDEASGELTVDDRRAMAGILNHSVAIVADRMTLLAATEVAATSMVRAMENSSAALLQMPGWPGEG